MDIEPNSREDIQDEEFEIVATSNMSLNLDV